MIILPSYLAKGLEFDTVIVLDASANNYQLESERTLLYTICSRAMHRLIVTSHGAISPLLADIPSDLYQTNLKKHLHSLDSCEGVFDLIIDLISDHIAIFAFKFMI
ncbi:hypothetical protein BN1423_700012 [Carnobacterium maltaromaticum]|nr:hypothetical protein BN1423_700012 [Carnobacterium maltaromaticum]